MAMFGRNKNDGDSEKPALEAWTTYLGGHKAYPKEHTCKVKIYGDHVEITKPALVIPFAKIRDVKYTKQANIGLLFVGKNTLTVIEYDDGYETQTVVIEFAQKLEEAQGLLYQGMLNARNC